MNSTNTQTQQQEHINQLVLKITTALSKKKTTPKKVSFLSRLTVFKQKNRDRIDLEVNGLQKSGTVKIFENNNQLYWGESEETITELARIESFENFATFIQTFEETMKNPIRHLVVLSSEVGNANWYFKKSGIWVFTVEAVQEIVSELDRQKAVHTYFKSN